MAKKRANGEGNIRKRKDGRWEGRYTAGYDPATGKRIIKNVLGKTQAECNQTRKMWQHIGQNVADNPLQAVTRADLGFTKADSALTKNEYLCKNFTLGRWIFLPSASIVPLFYC